MARDSFFHASAVTPNRALFDELQVDQTVEFLPTTGADGRLRAESVTVLYGE